MLEGCPAEMRMIRMILQDGEYDGKMHPCKVVAYCQEDESIYLLSEEMELPGFSLDGIYECQIETQEGAVSCLGNIRERYWNKLGRVIKFRIQNGFYKNLVN